MNRFRNQKGYTLIELMIGLLVGLIVLSAVLVAFISSLKSSREVINSARLNREMANIADIVTGELRRTGYYPIELTLTASASEFGAGRQDLYLNDDADCVLFGYYDDSQSTPGYVKRGFRLASAAQSIQFGEGSTLSCDNDVGWADISDSGTVLVSSFALNLDCTEIIGTSRTAVSAADCMASTVADATTSYSRLVSASVALKSAADDIWVTEASVDVYIPNNLSAP